MRGEMRAALRRQLDAIEEQARRQLSAVRQRARTRLRRFRGPPTRVQAQAARDLGLDADKAVKFELAPQHGFYLRISRKVRARGADRWSRWPWRSTLRPRRQDERCLRNNRKYTVIETQKSGIRFVNVTLERLNEQRREHHAQYLQIQETLVREVLQVAAGYCEPLDALNDTLAHLDVLCGLAHAAASAPIPYVRPRLLPMGSGTIRLVAARHPCVEAQDDVSFIANDASLIRGASWRRSGTAWLR